MSYKSKDILTDKSDKPIPQYFNKTKDEFEDVQGSDGATHMKIVDSTGKPIETIPVNVDLPSDYPDQAVEARLQAIEQTQSQILDKLNDTIDTRLTGSKVEEVLITRNIYNESIIARPSPPNWAKGAIISLHIFGSTGDFSNNGGLNIEGRMSLDSTNDVIKTSITDKYHNPNLRIAVHFYPGATNQDDPTSWVYVYGVNSMVTNRLWIRFNISGVFSEDEGIDFSSKIIYLG